MEVNEECLREVHYVTIILVKTSIALNLRDPGVKTAPKNNQTQGQARVVVRKVGPTRGFRVELSFKTEIVLKLLQNEERLSDDDFSIVGS